MSDWETLDSRVVYENPWIIVREDSVIMPDGTPGTYGYVDSKNDGVFIVPYDDDGNTYLVSLQRYTTKKTSLECPAGRMDIDETDGKVTAARELLEETGLKSQKLTHLSDLQVACGMTTFRCPVYLAEGVKKETDQLDETDGILGVKKVPLDQAIEMIMRQEIVCGQSIAALFMAREYLNEKFARESQEHDE